MESIAPPPHLESLGIPQVSDDDEESFVVLERENSIDSLAAPDLLPSLRSNRIHEIQSALQTKLAEMSLNATSEAGTKVQLSPDVSHEEIQKQVEDLITENETLKSTIAQNNISLKTQYDRFLTYQNEVAAVVQSYKDKLNGAKNCVERYKEENAKLVSDMEVYISIKKLQEEEIVTLKEKLLNNHGDNLPINAQTSTKEVEDLKEENSKLYSVYILKLKTDLENSTKESEAIKQENQKLNSDLLKLNTSLENSSTLCNALKEQDQKIQADLLKLNTDIGNAAKECEELKQKNLKLSSELLSKQHEIESFGALSNTTKLEAALQNKQEMINLLEFDISNLKAECYRIKSEKERELSKVSEELKGSKLCQAALSDEIYSLKSKLKILQESDINHFRAQLSTAQKTITALEVDQTSRIEEIEKLRRLLQENDHTDEMFALKEQLTLYKNDFDAEKESKMNIHREKEQVCEDLKNIQARNSQLQKEVETLRAKYEPKAEAFNCPKCSFKFSTYQKLENHVHRCLELDEFP